MNRFRPIVGVYFLEHYLTLKNKQQHILGKGIGLANQEVQVGPVILSPTSSLSASCITIDILTNTKTTVHVCACQMEATTPRNSLTHSNIL